MDENWWKLIKIDTHNSFDLRYLSITDINRLITIVSNRIESIISSFIDLARRVKPTLLTAIIAVLLLHFETGLQHYFLSSYSLETLFNCIHKIARIIKRKHIQSASSPNIFECGPLLKFESYEFFRAEFKSENS